MMSRAGLREWCPLATPVLLMSVNVPDIDFASMIGGDAAILEWHRGPTHAIFFAALMAALPLAPMWLFERGRMLWWRAYVVSILGVLSHIALDWTNIYGVRLLEPFTAEYYHLDITGVTDLWMLGAMAAAAGWFAISSLVSTEIGARKTGGRSVAAGVLLFLCLWQAGRYFLHERALEILDSRIYDGEVPSRVAALPHFGSPLHWTGLVETERAYRLFEIDLRDGDFDPAGGQTYFKPRESTEIEIARQSEVFSRFLAFSHYPLWSVLPVAEPEGAVRVQAMDMRFGHPGEERFVSTAIIDRSGRILRSWFQFDPPGGGPRFR